MSTLGLMVIAGFQLTKFRKAYEEETRPHVDATVTQAPNSKGDTSLYLVVRNLGNALAQNVTLSFPDDGKWKSLNGRVLAFEKQNGITSFPPNAELWFFLGRSSADLVGYYSKEEPIEINARYLGPRRTKPYISKILVSLLDVYGAKRSS